MGEYNIGQFIYRSRKAMGLTQEEMCQDENGNLYFSVETLSRIERGKQRPNYRTMRYMMRRIGKENCFCAPYLKTADYYVLELNRELKRLITLGEYESAEKILAQMEEQLSLRYATNRQYLIRIHATIDQRLGRISTEEALKLMETALQLTVHSYGTERFFFEVLVPEEVVIVCNIADCYGRLRNIEKALELLDILLMAMNDSTLQLNYPDGLPELVNRNRIKWLGEQGKYLEAVRECSKAIRECIEKGVAITLPSLFYARAYNLQMLKDTVLEWKEYDQKVINSDYVKCALLANLFHDENGKDRAIAKLKKEKN